MSSSRAIAYVRSRIRKEMTYAVVAERVTRPTVDDDLIASPGSRIVLFESQARIWEVSANTSINVGQADVDVQSTQISFPWETPLLKKNDEITVTEAPLDSELVGKRYQIQSSVKAGNLRSTRRYSVTVMN